MEPTLPELPRILVVDDEPVIREILADFLSMEGFAVQVASDGDEALALVSRVGFDLVLTDMKMPKMGGLELLEALRKAAPSVVTVMMTGFGTVESAIDAMKRGAYDYVLKPFKIDEVVLTLRRALSKQKLEAENLRLREALSLYKVSEAIAASLSLEDVLSTVVDAALHEIEADQVLVALADGFGGFFERVSEVRRSFARELASTHGVEPEALATETIVAHLHTSALAAYFVEDLPLRVHGTAAARYLQGGDASLPISSLIVTPLRARGAVIGFLGVVAYGNHRRFEEGERKLLRIIASRASAAIENAKLYEDLKATFQQTIKGLASAIDKMDRYTAGHSERVAAYSQVLAIKLGLSPEDVEIARQAALMHDIGKIGCVMNLNKPGKLSTQEFEVFKAHPGYGKDILEPITFLHPLIPGVHLHHERWDGQGYPLGLEAQAIPLLARIVSVADTYDAMTSDRAYRRALPHEVALSEICRCSRSQFDPMCTSEFAVAIEADREERAARGESIPE